MTVIGGCVFGRSGRMKLEDAAGRGRRGGSKRIFYYCTVFSLSEPSNLGLLFPF